MKKNKRRKFWVILTIILLCFVIIGVLNFEKIQGYFAGQLSNNRTEMRNARNNRQKHKPDYNLQHVQPISPELLIKAWRNRQDYRSVGQIAIKDQNILLNIYRGCGNNELALGAGTFRRNQRMGKNNYPIAAHNMDDARTYFSPLFSAASNGSLKKGTTIFLTDFKQVYFYRLVEYKFISIYNLNLSYNSKKYAKSPVVTLFTCDYTGQGRLYIKGKLTGSQSLESASKYVKSVFLI